MRQNKDGEPKLFRLFGHFSLVLFLSTSLFSAQSFSEFKNSQVKSFSKYKDEKDNAFNSYLKEQWKAYNVFKGTPLYEKPKPKTIAKAPSKPIKSVGPKVSIKVEKVKFVEPKPAQKFIIYKAPKKKIPKKEIVIVIKKQETKKEIKKEVVQPIVVSKDISFDFYGSYLGFDIPTGIKKAKFYPQNQKGISNFFDSAASSDYDNLINDIKKVSKNMNLNDWGVYLLILKISSEVHHAKDNSNLLSWFIFNKLGYAVKVGLAQRHIVLLHYSKKNYLFYSKL
ncbi:hypothetical protein [Sulfurimonas sp.]|uniref:hypothetical protein n=1 Tax=Sulfurimonas sp. TaxID=2022749 RepID=UPI002AAFAEFC|nr:hypothetical protein [Sulfurimonas sp.]